MDARWCCGCRAAEHRCVGDPMRDRQALTRREIAVPLEFTLVARTDLDGRIGDLSPDLALLTGHDADELTGEYDEVLLHPDMPRAVIEDMRRDLGAGRPWCGVLKYRCRNGDHFWARVDTVPIREHGYSVGFVSVCRRAMRDQVERADEAYRYLRERRADDLGIDHGRVVRSGRIARATRRCADIPARFMLLGGAVLATVSGMVFAGFAGRFLNGSIDGLLATAALAVALAGLALGAGSCVAASAGIRRRLRDARRIMEALAAGEYHSHIEYWRDDEVGRLLQHLKVLQVRLEADCRHRARGGIADWNAGAAAAVRSMVRSMSSNAATVPATVHRREGAPDAAHALTRSGHGAAELNGNHPDHRVAATHAQPQERFTQAIRQGSGVAERIVAIASAPERTADAPGNAHEHGRLAGRAHIPAQSVEPSLRSARRTVTISPLRPARRELRAPLPKIGRTGVATSSPGDGWEEFHE